MRVITSKSKTLSLFIFQKAMSMIKGSVLLLSSENWEL